MLSRVPPSPVGYRHLFCTQAHRGEILTLQDRASGSAEGISVLGSSESFVLFLLFSLPLSFDFRCLDPLGRRDPADPVCAAALAFGYSFLLLASLVRSMG